MPKGSAFIEHVPFTDQFFLFLRFLPATRNHQSSPIIISNIISSASQSSHDGIPDAVGSAGVVTLSVFAGNTVVAGATVVTVVVVVGFTVFEGTLVFVFVLFVVFAGLRGVMVVTTVVVCITPPVFPPPPPPPVGPDDVGDVTLNDTGLLYASSPTASITFTPYVNVPVADVDGEYVKEVAPVIAVLVAPDIVYHWYVYGEVPPFTVAVSVSVPPVVTDDELLDADTVGSLFTVITTLFETIGYSSGYTIIPLTVYVTLPVEVGVLASANPSGMLLSSTSLPELIVLPFDPLIVRTENWSLPLLRLMISFTVSDTG